MVQQFQLRTQALDPLDLLDSSREATSGRQAQPSIDCLQSKATNTKNSFYVYVSNQNKPPEFSAAIYSLSNESSQRKLSGTGRRLNEDQASSCTNVTDV